MDGKESRVRATTVTREMFQLRYVPCNNSTFINSAVFCYSVVENVPGDFLPNHLGNSLRRPLFAKVIIIFYVCFVVLEFPGKYDFAPRLFFQQRNLCSIIVCGRGMTCMIDGTFSPLSRRQFLC